MANTLGVYNPTFYANEALIQLWSALGLASRVHMGFDAERRTFDRGDTINIRRPGSFTAENAPGTAQDLATETVSITLDQWKTVKFSLTDKELAYTGDRIINDHIRPAAYALAENIDTALNSQWGSIAGSYPGAAYSSGGEAVNNVIQTRKKLQDRKAPLSDAENMFFQVTPGFEADLLREAAFSQWQGSDGVGVETQRTGLLGRRYGMEFFTNQNIPTATYIDFTDFAGAVVGAEAVGSTSIEVNALGNEAKVDKGRIVTFAGDTQEYVVTADATITTNAATLIINPPLKVALSGSEVVTIQATPDNTTVYQNLAFHRNFMALAMARLPDFAGMDGLGANIASVQDPVTGLSLRSRIYYVGASSKIEVALDVLYGYALLDPNLAVRMELA
jgi:hypothetical protein